MRNVYYFVLASCLVGFATHSAAAEPSANGKASAGERLFVASVEPLLRRKCIACHGKDPDDIKGEFDLRSRETLLRGGESGEAGLVPGKPAESLLWQAVRWETIEMPPKENDRLSEKEIELVGQWIEAGAPWPSAERIKQLGNETWSSGSPDGVIVATSGGQSDEWTNRRYDPADLWAYQPVEREEIPWQALPAGAVRHPIDAFLTQSLAAAKLPAAPRASRAALIRRLSFDLTGLPPSAQQIEAFVGDDSRDSWESLVDRLLASEHYGERMAQHWLDVVRYADTNGFSRDDFRPDAWKYRDYVIESFNTDKPYDTFVREQLAADELDNAPQNATGFLWMGPWEQTAMSVAAVTRQLWLDDVTNSVGITFLAHELRCAKCHDHKFDPIPTRDYYQIQAVFAATAHSKGGGNYEIRNAVPKPVNILAGGSLESPGEQVNPGVMSVVGADANVTAKRDGRRRELAEWVASPSNPLTARVMVNRVWQMHFGKGLVATPNNFGKTGAKPTHPALLDWLATWFVEHDWSVKSLHRLIVTSAAYQRSGRHPQAELLAKVDPGNKLLSVFPTRRLTAEEIKDSLLAVTGELNRKIGGASNFPEINWEVAFQPRLQMGKLSPPYQPDSKRADRNRRALYAVRFRGMSNPMLETFNRPGADLSCERRDETIVAPQALTMLHGEFVHERALALANQISKEYATESAQVDAVFNAAYGRPPTDRQRAAALKHLAEMTQMHEAHRLEHIALPTEVELDGISERTGVSEKKKFPLNKLKNYEQDLQPWEVEPSVRAVADLCLVLFNSSEFLYIY
ncbi:unnamed protein product [Cladocopium goreaui]|uniref:Cytochrome c domain-containing protein n=1 Tax=Cladocopium goreaui TaxID=2562237 RepID=A0A9P1DLQ5_9DINO|nr:unnamed protein product [Cladocopium goreaui]